MLDRAVWKKIIEIVLDVSIVCAGITYHGQATPLFVMLMFFAMISGVTLYVLKNESKKDMKINTLFLFLKPFIIGEICTFFGKPFDLVIAVGNFLNLALIVCAYLLFRNPFQILYKRIGVWAVIDNIIPAILLAVLAILHINQVIAGLLTLLSWMIMIRITWNFKRKDTNAVSHSPS
jgi:hypothetical protein